MFGFLQKRAVKSYSRPGGQCPFKEWIESLRDRKAVRKIGIQLDRMRLGHFGDCRSVGKGVFESRIHYGPGYRLYFGIVASEIIILYGGDKSTQDKDIKKAQTYWVEAKEIENENNTD